MKAFNMYRVVCTITDKALVDGEDYPNPIYEWRYGYRVDPPERKPWYERGTWSATGGQFWRTEHTVRHKLQCLCHDWERHSALAQYPQWEGQRRYWTEAIPGTLDWSRLDHLRVDKFTVTEFSVSKVDAKEFMGMLAANAA